MNNTVESEQSLAIPSAKSIVVIQACLKWLSKGAGVQLPKKENK